jgi:TatD DNase family protein
MLFDTHAHFDSRQFNEDRDELLSSLPSQGISLIVNPGCDIPTSRMAVEIAERHPFVYAAVGFHPEETPNAELSDLEEIRRLAAHEKVVAIGEIGLDYYWVKDEEGRKKEQEFFRAQMAMAEELNLPVIVHDREAHGDTLAIVKEFPNVRGVFHCYSGSVEMAQELVKIGWILSFTGVLTYHNARKAVEVAEAIPLEHLMIETDSPYMAPVPYRGKRNHSGYVRYVCEKLAEIKGISVEECAEITLKNGCRFFGISPQMP